MLAEIIDNPDLDKYIKEFAAGHIIFLEGDASQDLYILVSGRLAILKGNKKISEVTDKGALFGEMSFLLGAKRTASVKTKSTVRAICIPKEEVTTFLGEFPGLAWEITRLLAQRLDQTSQVVYGLKEFCDQLPDAVVLADREGKVLTCNAAAERLYGRDSDQMSRSSVEELYEQPQDYKDFLEEVQSRYSVREKILRIKNPEKGMRFISTSTTILYDGHHNFQGVLSLGRDVTTAKDMERKYKKTRNWLIPSFILIGLLTLAVLFAWPRLLKEQQTLDSRKHSLRNQLAKDYLLLESMLAGHLAAGDREKANRSVREFFDIQEPSEMIYTGLILLDKDKMVFDSYAAGPGIKPAKMAKSSYCTIELKGIEDSLHRVLTLYRANKGHPMGHKSIEIAFEIRRGGLAMGWIIFLMDADLLARVYDVDEKSLKKFQFKKP